jgi:hypothetical protein
VLPIDAEQLLDNALRLLVASLAEVLVADDASRVGEVERRPVVVGEGAPDLVVVVGRDRIVDLAFLHRLPHAVDVVLERELGRVDPDHEQPVVSVRLRPGADVGLLAQPVDARHVQKFTSTTRPRSSAGPSGSEPTHPVAPSSEGIRTRANTDI